MMTPLVLMALPVMYVPPPLKNWSAVYDPAAPPPASTAKTNEEGTVTVTTAVPLKLPLVARTVAGPVPEEGAVYRPLALIEPIPPLSMLQVTPGWLLKAAPN